MSDPTIERVIRELTARGDRLEAEAIRAVARLYGNLNLTQLITLLRAATELDSPLARVAYLDDLMRAWDSAAAGLAHPPEALAQSVRSAVQSGITGTAQMFAASQQVIDAFTVPATLQLQWMGHSERRMKEFWGNEPVRLRQEIHAAIRDGLERGQGIDQISKRIQVRAGVSRSRATLIARDQVSSASAFAMRESQSQAGVTKYIWRTASDKRVRDSHAARDGKEFSWDDPPPDGHPGEPVQCRCVALAVIPDGGIKVGS